CRAHRRRRPRRDAGVSVRGRRPDGGADRRPRRHGDGLRSHGMDLGLKGRVVVVTGGTSGIGLATVRLLLREGAFVALCGRDESRLAQTQGSLAKEFAADHVLAERCDVIDKDQVARFAAAVTQWRGACDALINNAGGGRVSTFADTDDAAW